MRCLIFIALAFALRTWAAETPNVAHAPPVHAAPPQPLRIPEIDKPVRVPDGPSHDAWDLYVKNDFDGAVKAFTTVLDKDGKDLVALEGLRAVYEALGDYKAVQDTNLRMVKAAPEHILCGIFGQRAMDMRSQVENREALMAAFTEVSAHASSPVLSALKDNIAALQIQAEHPAEARKTLEGLGYIDRWQFVAGPFGRKDRNELDVRARNLIERRFAPERELKSLEFNDETGEKVDVFKDVPANFRELSMDTLFHGVNGVYYAFTNLQSESDQDVLMGFGAAPPYRVFLRGLPVLLEPSDEHYHRTSGELIRVKLLKGANPLLIKLTNTRPLIVRVFGADYGIPQGVRTAPLDEKALAEHQVSTVRGFRMSEKVTGSAADFFMKLLTDEDRKSKSLKPLVESGALNLAEAAWLDGALQRENDNPTRLLLARTLLGSFKDSVGVLDSAATIMNAAGRATGDTETREVLEAKLIRERALGILPTSHQHLLQMFNFQSEHDLKDEAFNTAKLLAQAHPQSPAALATLAQAYENKQFMVEAEQNLEKAAALDNAFLPRLEWFHEIDGNRTRARELYLKRIELGMVDHEQQFDIAIRRGELDKAAALLDGLDKDYPERAEDLKHQRIRLLTEQGKLDEAYALQKKIYEGQKEYDPNRRSTLQALVDLGLRLSKDDEAKALLAAYLKDNEGDFDVSRRLHDLQGETAQARWWEDYDVKVPQVDASAFTAEKFPTANYAWIVDFMVTKIQPDLSRESYIHIAHKVLNTEGITNLSELLVQAQRQNILFVRTLNPDGSAFQPQNVHDFNLSQTASLYKVVPGSILEHAYVDRAATDKDDPSLSMAFNFNAIDSPRAVSRWVVMIPDELKDKLAIRKIRPEMVDEKILPGPKGYTVYQWTNKQIEGIKQEPFMPVDDDQEVIPLVFVESADRPYHANRLLMHRQPEFLPEAAADKARELVSGLAGKPDTEAAQFARILDWVRDNIKPGPESHTLDDVWFSHAGSTYQMMNLAREMSKAVGLNVSTALLNGYYVPQRWHGKNAKHTWEPSELASFGNAGQMLVLEPPNGIDRWAQFMGNSPKYYDYWETTAIQSGAFALVHDRGVARIKRVRGETLGLTNATQRVEISLDGQGSGRIDGFVELFGTLAGQIREALSDPRYGERMKEQIARASWRNLQIGKISTVGEGRPETPLGFSFTGSAKSLASSAGPSYFLYPFPGKARIMELRGPGQRQSDLLLKSEVADIDQTLTYNAPEGYAWTEVPDNLFICSEFGWYLADFSVNGRTLTCTRSYLMPMQRVTPEKYPKLVEFLNQVGSSQQQRIAYSPLPKDLPGPLQSVMSIGYSSFGDEK